jgi:hypothetical protein
LRLFQFTTRILQRKETGLIDFRKILHLSGARWPFHFEPVRAALEAVRQISLKRPGINGLAPLLLHPTEINPIGARCRDAHLLFELDSRTTQQIFSRINFAFRYCPDAIIFISIKRTARVSEQDFQLVAPSPKHYQSSADS